MSIWDYAEHLPNLAAEHRITLGEGGTPLVRSRRVGPALGLTDLWFKLECCNPTGSFKDRFAVLAVSHMCARGQRACLATSSGNTGAALAAACAAAGLACYVAVVDGAPRTKVQNMQAYGAQVYTVRGFGRDPRVSQGVMDTLRQLCAQGQAALQISNYDHSPDGMVGCETLAYELHDQAGPSLAHVFTQSGAGGMTRAVALGFLRLKALGRCTSTPRVHCVQPEGNNTIAGPLRSGAERAQEVTCTSTISGLQVPNVIGGHEVLPACRATGGTGYVVSDAAIYAAQERLAREEGIFAEPAGATAFAGLIQAVESGEIAPHERAVCLVTGTGLKDEKSLVRMTETREFPMLDQFTDIEALLAQRA